MDWVKGLSYLLQKGFNGAAGYVGLKLTVLDANVTTYPGGNCLARWGRQVQDFGLRGA
jgi:hypothetical protein